MANDANDRMNDKSADKTNTTLRVESTKIEFKVI
jgi:hypothetical protein